MINLCCVQYTLQKPPYRRAILILVFRDHFLLSTLCFQQLLAMKKKKKEILKIDFLFLFGC